jgi:hypothetical protein
MGPPAQAPTPAQAPAEDGSEVDEEVEFPSLPVLQASLQSSDVEDRMEAVQQISVFVSEAYGSEGMELGVALRDSGTVALLVKLVSDPSAEVRAHALLALGNLCSDSVDPQSAATKALLLELGMEQALMGCIASDDESVLLVACATLQNLCHDANWAKRVVAAGVEARLEKLVAHEDARVVRYASGALKNLTIASATMGAPGPQLSATATDAVRRRELEASVEEFMQRRACRAIGRGVGRMDAPSRLQRLLRAPSSARDVAWLDALSELHGVIEERVAILEFQLHQATAAASAAAASINTSPEAAVAASKGGDSATPHRPPPEIKPPPDLSRLQDLLAAAENAVAELLGELPEEFDVPDAAAAAGAPSAAVAGGGGGDEVPEEVPEEDLPDGETSPARRQTPAAAAAAAAARVAANGGSAKEAAAAGAAAAAAVTAAAAAAGERAGSGSQAASAAPHRPPPPVTTAAPSRKATQAVGGAGGDEEVPEEVPEEPDVVAGMGGSSRGLGLSKRSPTGVMNIPAEANREAAEEWTRKARQQYEAGDDVEALRLLGKSLKLCETASARSLHDHIRKYGAGSAAAQAVARVLNARDHHEVMNLDHSAAPLTAAELKKAYRQLSLRLHPDRNHAQHASDAFKRLSEAYTALSSAEEGGGGAAQQPVATPHKPQQHAPHATPTSARRTPQPPPQPPPQPASQDHGDDWGDGDGTPRGPNLVRRRRRWEKVFGLGKKRSSVERD